ncbi:Acetamidase [Triangularia setosa]|uniref:Acetamidase n=1 Tax=Triangularia setosa TaxID=2587417 RepID=A0AAN6VYZ0_9PEZI|nr:Acetamidase [Podospora setosa]
MVSQPSSHFTIFSSSLPWFSFPITSNFSRYIRLTSVEMSSQRESVLARKSQRNIIEIVQQHLKATHASIVVRTVTKIISRLKDGTFSALQMTMAFCKGNCLHGIFFDQALDIHFKETGTVYGPLHGLPINLKDQFYVKGVDTTMSYVGWIGSNFGFKDPSQAQKVDSQIPTELLSLGEALHCKTSLAQTLPFAETKNNIICETLNPHNRNLSRDGSSGSECALQALRDTDIGGSPTPERLSYRDIANTNPGLELALRATLSTSPWLRDPAVLPIPFRQVIFDEYRSRDRGDGIASPMTNQSVSPHPHIPSGLRLFVDTLKPLGTSRLPASNRFPSQVPFLLVDSSHNMHRHLALLGEPLIPDLEEAFESKIPINLLQYRDLTLEGLEYEAAYSDYWNSTADGDDGQIVDAMIIPVAPHAVAAAYTEVINLKNYSVAVIFTTKADNSINIVPELDKMDWEAYDPETYDGVPVAVQLVAREFEEEKILPCCVSTLPIGEVVTATLATYGKERK